MKYHINNAILDRNSSIEHGEFILCNNEGQILTKDWNNHTSRILSNAKLRSDIAINMFDYFGDSVDLTKIDPIDFRDWFEDFNLDATHAPKNEDGNDYKEVKIGDRIVAKVFLVGGMVDKIDHIDWVDQRLDVYKREDFDIRGWKSKVSYFGIDGNVLEERYLNKQGKTYLTRGFVPSNDGPFNSLTKLTWNDSTYYFSDGLDAMFTFFLEQTTNEDDELIVDRPELIQSVLNAQVKAPKKYWYQFDNKNDSRKSALDILKMPWDGIIYSTHQQYEIMHQFNFNNHEEVLNLPESNNHQPIHNHDLMFAGDINQDRKIGDLISIAYEVRKEIPDVQLHIYGYGQDSEGTKLVINGRNDLNEDLSNLVIYHDYIPDLEPEFKKHSIYVDAGDSNNFPWAMYEAKQAGLPIVSYDYSYGPSEILDGYDKMIYGSNQSQFIKALVKMLITV